MLERIDMTTRTHWLLSVNNNIEVMGLREREREREREVLQGDRGCFGGRHRVRL